MEINQSNTAGGSLQIASEVVEKIARLAAMEINGVAEVSLGNSSVKNLLSRINPQNPILVEMKDDVADITLNIVVEYGTKIAELSEAVQKNVKSSVQSMTQITVAKVNIVVTGIAVDEPVPNAARQ
ncbi:MAG: Asp23/Gls24 family envelope stress response protein [Oscillospiraceae bacterium]